MTNTETRRANKAGLRKSLNIIRNSVRKGAARVTSNKEKINQGAKLIVYSSGSGGQVDIYHHFQLSNAKGRGMFSMRYLDQGTKEGIIRRADAGRYKGRKHGATPAKPFFLQAVAEVKEQANSTLSDNILTQIEKIASKRR